MQEHQTCLCCDSQSDKVNLFRVEATKGALKRGVQRTRGKGIKHTHTHTVTCLKWTHCSVHRIHHRASLTVRRPLHPGRPHAVKKNTCSLNQSDTRPARSPTRARSEPWSADRTWRLSLPPPHLASAETLGQVLESPEQRVQHGLHTPGRRLSRRERKVKHGKKLNAVSTSPSEPSPS